LDLDVNAADKNNQTALHYAVIGTVDEPELVTALLKRGANPEARDRWGQTPLILAAHQNLTRSVQALLDQGANVNAENEDGYTALVAASKVRASTFP
jgi:ankyrin repeat protein